MEEISLRRLKQPSHTRSAGGDDDDDAAAATTDTTADTPISDFLENGSDDDDDMILERIFSEYSAHDADDSCIRFEEHSSHTNTPHDLQ